MFGKIIRGIVGGLILAFLGSLVKTIALSNTAQQDGQKAARRLTGR